MKYLISRKKVVASLVKIDQLETNSMIVHPLNKDVPMAVFKKHVSKAWGYWVILMQQTHAGNQWEQTDTGSCISGSF